MESINWILSTSWFSNMVNFIMTLFIILKLCVVILPIWGIFYFGDKNKWDDPGCSLWGGKDLIYND